MPEVTFESDELASGGGDIMMEAAGSRRRAPPKRKKARKRNTASRQTGIPPTARAEWARRKTQAGVEHASLGKDGNGYYAYHGSRRTGSYKSPKKIPLAAIRDVSQAR